jgi:UDP-4-amino-4-deoxy-L-arabinose formyltransferase/UDP-glucuronic acid dehydrogenase (UDP-4-keto-hexauronic acid decarboxylating)
MPGRPLRVVIVAEEAAGVQTLHGLSALHPRPEITAVLTEAEPKTSRRPLVYEAARSLGLDTWPAELVRTPELAVRLQEAAVDLLVNVHSLSLVHPDVVRAPRIGSFNLHPGPLPEYAGLMVPSWAIYNGEETHAVALHWMDDGIDTGPVAWMEWFALSDADTGLAVSAKCVRHGVPLVLKLVQTAALDPSSIPRTEQDLSRRRYFRSHPPQGGRIEWSRSAAEIIRFVRAADYGPFDSPWGHPRTLLLEREVGVVRASRTTVLAGEAPGRVQEVTDAGAAVATADELVLVERLWLDGRYIKPIDFFAGEIDKT